MARVAETEGQRAALVDLMLALVFDGVWPPKQDATEERRAHRSR